MAITSDLWKGAQESAHTKLSDAARAFIDSAVPKLTSDQHAYIAARAVNDPVFFDAMRTRYGSELIDIYLRQHAKGD